MDSADDVLYPDAVYPALEPPATELERLVVEMLTEPRFDPLDYRDLFFTEARHRRLIP